MCHCALIDKWIFNLFFTLYFVLRWPSVVDGMLKFHNCAGAEDIQSVDSEHDMNMSDSWWTAGALNTADTEEQTENDPLNSTHPERYRHWTLQTLNPTDNWILDWTLLTLNNSRQTMNAIDCNPANTEDHWLCMLQLYPIDWTLKKLNWCYRLWTLLALNAVELSRRYRLMLNTVYTESYWHINSTQLTLHWTLQNNTERANCSERYT